MARPATFRLVPGFEDQYLGVFTSTGVQGGLPVLLVFHDEDGAWQFLSGLEETADQAVHVHLSHVLDADETLEQLADLPVGWKAWRRSLRDRWTREEISKDQDSI